MVRFLPLSSLRDRRIVDPSGEPVGHIHDVLFDLRDGRIEYICIAVANAGNEEIYEAVVPWSAVRRRGSGSPWEVAARKRTLEDIARPVSQRD